VAEGGGLLGLLRFYRFSLPNNYAWEQGLSSGVMLPHSGAFAPRFAPQILGVTVDSGTWFGNSTTVFWLSVRQHCVTPSLLLWQRTKISVVASEDPRLQTLSRGPILGRRTI
jgi:hypothetical protein